jgi:OOP family OmpA-OmpF porin
MRLTKNGSRALIILAVVGLGFGLRTAAQKGVGRKYMPAFLVPKTDIGDFGAVSMQGSAKQLYDLPSSVPASGLPEPTVRVNFWAWNSQMGCLYANGGPITTKNSLMAKQGVRMQIDRQDDNSQLQAQLTALAKGLHDGSANPTTGVMFVGIMGDGAGAFLTPLNRELTKAYGPEYRAEIVGSCGYSRGEDKLMGPSEWASNPSAMKGSLIAGVLRDGDWNIAMRYAGDNNIPNNPDENTYDPNAINWVNPKDYIDAAQKYIENYCEDRRVVNNGKPTGETKHVCVQGVVTWTPGDVNIAKNRGGLVSVVSTKEYANQMPHVIIGIRKWNQTHRDIVEKVLLAFAEGGDQVLTYPQALDKAASISQEINKESGATAEYWKKYYLGVNERDKQGIKVDLGGSKANNLADELKLFGLSEGTSPQTSIFHATYNTFGNLSAKMYPQIMPHLAPEDSVLDTSYLAAVAEKVGSGNIGKAETVSYSNSDTVSKVVGRRNVAIEFQTGQATLTPQGEQQLSTLLNELTINTLRVVVHGHTDNTGTPTKNEQLSEDRALAVKSYLESKSPTNFPTGRISVRAHGSNDPVASNATESGRRQNRRVEIVIGQ